MTAQTKLTIACLCAEWCGTCRDYRGVFDALPAGWAGHHFRWIDIEDEADLVGDIDVPTFPTLLIACGEQVLFAGPVLPKEADTQRLIASVAESWSTGQASPAARMPAAERRPYEVVAAALQAN